MTADLISCLVPVYNGERYLREALDSIVGQTYRPIEIIVIDDGSTDCSVSVVEDFPFPILVVPQQHAGPAAAKNRGVQSARGRYIAFLDADDLWHSDKLARQYALFRDHADLDLCISAMRNFWTADLHAEELAYRDQPRAGPMAGYAQTALLARRDAFDRFGLFDETLLTSDVIDWFLRAVSAGARLELLPDVLTYRRLHGKNLSRTHAETGRQEFIRLIHASVKRRRELGGPPLAFPTL